MDIFGMVLGFHYLTYMMDKIDQSLTMTLISYQKNSFAATILNMQTNYTIFYDTKKEL